MFKTCLKASAVVLTLSALSSAALAEKLPKQSTDFKGNYDIAIKDNNAKPETALCSATVNDLTKNTKYKYDRFGFTQADYDAAILSQANGSALTTVKLSGEARPRNGATNWDKVTVVCTVNKKSVRSVAVTVQK
ncbi:BspC domain-containing protein [Pseudochrobactrum sp. MP213Fo]|uniref:BspC domain-containing protein n=1 Tax=Pseudochrobactrum sp. MP213Fo TaxID=3022250 RepID=UPI003BA0A210